MRIEKSTPDWGWAGLPDVTTYYAFVQELGLDFTVTLHKKKLGTVDYGNDPQKALKKVRASAERFKESFEKYCIPTIPFYKAAFTFKHNRKTRKDVSYQLYDGNGNVRPDCMELIENGHFKKEKYKETEEF